MQPVTIKNNQFLNSLWISQVCLLLLMVIVILVGVLEIIWFLIVLPVFILAYFSNHQTIYNQSNIQLTMRTNGQLIATDQSQKPQLNSKKQASESLGVFEKDDEISADILAFWYLPHILMLKLEAKQVNKPIYITVFRAVVGAQKFSNLLVGLTQLNTSLQNKHDQI